MIGLLRLCRLYYAVPFSLGFAIILYYARGGRMAGSWGEAAIATGAVLLVIAGGYVLNDVCDVEVDRLNAPGRPLVVRSVSRREALTFATLLFGGGLAASLACPPAFSALLAGVALGLTGYDLASKRLGVAKQLLVALLMVSLYPLAFALAGGVEGRRAGALALFPAWLFLTSFAYEILKDLRDREGDRVACPSPTSLQREPRLWRGIASAATLVGMPLAVAPYWFGCGEVYLGVAVVALGCGLASLFLTPQRALLPLYAEIALIAAGSALDIRVSGF